MELSPKLEEYRCPKCGKLLFKGNLTSVNNVLEVKCKNCHTLSVFHGKLTIPVKKDEKK